MTPDKLRATAKEVSARIVAIGPLKTAHDAELAAYLLRTLHQVRAEGEDARKEAKAPSLTAGRAIDAYYKPALQELDRVMGMIKRRLADRALERDAMRTRALTADPETANALLAELGDEKHERLYERWTWSVAQVDLSQVPLPFLQLNEKAVKSEIKRADQEARRPRVDGIVFEREVMIVARRES